MHINILLHPVAMHVVAMCYISHIITLVSVQYD
jgi:hypothetical protein